MSRRLVVAGAASTLLLVACGGDPVGDLEGGAGADQDSEQETGQDSDQDGEGGGELVFALPDEPDVLDPTQGRTLVGRMVFINMCEGLYSVSPEVDVNPNLAADLPEFSDDGLTATIPIREDVVFQDGTELDAEAVKLSLDRHREMSESARASDLAPVEEVVVADPMTIEIHLSEPMAPLAATLSDRAGIIMSPAALDELGDDFGQEPVCVGPFEFVERGNERIVLERAENYHDADQVQLDRVVYQTINDGNIRTANLRSGDVHMAERINTTDVEQIESDPGLTMYDAVSLGYWGIFVNIGNTDGIDEPPGEPDHPLADPRVREAFELTLDRDLINDVVFNGVFAPGCTPITPGTPFAPDVECPARDLDRAAQLLDEAGVDTPVPVRLLARTDPENLRFAELVQSMAEEGGFEVEVDPREFTTGQDEAMAGDFEIYHAGWSGRLDPDGNLHAFHHSAGTFNYGLGVDDSVDQLLDEARTTIDDDARRQHYSQVIEEIRERRNFIYLYHSMVFIAATSTIEGFELTGDGLPRLKTAGFAE